MNIQVAQPAGAPLTDLALPARRDRFVLQETAAPLQLPTRKGFRVRPLLALAAGFLVLLLLAAVHPGWLTPIDPQAADAGNAFLAPGFDHWLGTDENGRDVLARLIYGARASLLTGLGATLISVGGGIVIGLAAGLGGRHTDGVLMRAVEVIASFPPLLMALVVITFWGQGLTNAIVAIGVALIPRYARLVRAQTQIVRSAGYVEAAATLGLRRETLIWRHVLPNAIKPVLVLATASIGMKISAGAALSFLGFGAPPPAPEWGAMLSMGRNYLANAVWLVIAPGMAISLTVLAITAVGRAFIARSEGVRR